MMYSSMEIYMQIDARDVTFEDNQPFKSILINDNFFVSGFSTFIDAVDIDYLTVYQRRVGAGGTVLVAISSTSDLDGQVGGRVSVTTRC